VTAKHVGMVASGIALILIALWGGAIGWQFIDTKDMAFSQAMIYTQLLTIGGGGLLIIFGASRHE
jgi:hypothetical protein